MSMGEFRILKMGGGGFGGVGQREQGQRILPNFSDAGIMFPHILSIHISYQLMYWDIRAGS